MTLQQFKHASGFASLLEVEKVCHLAFFYLKTDGIEEFSVTDAADWLVTAGAAAPNRTRLGDRLRATRDTIKSPRGFRLSLEFVKDLEERFPSLGEKSQEVIEQGTILPELDYKSTRGYIESLAKQINASYEHNLFDGCAVLMRRLVEILLVLSYRKLQIENSIRDSAGNYQMLESIINDAKSNHTLDLSRNSKASLEIFRQLGNFSAHKIEYTCRREYLKPHLHDYRALIFELLHKAGIRS